MKITAKPGERLTIDDVLAFVEQARADARRKCMSDLLARADDFDDWDQAMSALEAFDESATWRDELRQQLFAAFAEANAKSRMH
jgi:hypothetical protein